MDPEGQPTRLLRETFHVSPVDLKTLVRYWAETEVHVFSFSIAANVLLSFYPFLLVMVSLCREVLHWPEAEQAIYLAIRDFFAGDVGNFLARNLAAAFQLRPRKLEWVSILLLLFTANGIFMPLEVALNRAWGVTKNRSFWKNQLVSTGLIFGCGALVLLSAVLSAANQELMTLLLGRWPGLATFLGTGLFKLSSFPITVLILVLIYWILPNTKVEPRYLVPNAIRVGLALEVLKWINLLVWPWLLEKFRRETVVFEHSVTIITWSFMAAMVVLAGADASARRARAMQERDEDQSSPIVENRDRIQSESISSSTFHQGDLHG